MTNIMSKSSVPIDNIINIFVKFWRKCKNFTLTSFIINNKIILIMGGKRMDLFGNKSHKGTEELVSYEIKGKANSKLIFGFVHYCTFKHGDIKTNLIKSQVYENYEQGHTITPNTAKYVCFEVPENISMQELAQNEVFSTLDKIGKLDELKENSYNHIGFINKMEDGRYEIFNPTIEVLSYIDENMNTKIGQSDNLLAKRIKFVESISKPALKKMTEDRQEREQRKKEPFLEEQLRYKIGDNVYTDYKGININTGRIIKLSKLKCTYEENEINLYSTYISEVLEDEEQQEKIVTLEDTPQGFPILFTTAQKMEKILENNKEGEILKLLSDIQKENLNINELRYIGGIDTEGRIYKTSENCSEELKQTIESQKQEYKKQKQIQSER